jgi:hypothetical protein
MIALLFLFLNVACANPPPSVPMSAISIQIDGNANVVNAPDSGPGHSSAYTGAAGSGDMPSGHYAIDPAISSVNHLLSGHKADPIHDWGGKMDNHREQVNAYTHAVKEKNQQAFQRAREGAKKAPPPEKPASFGKRNFKTDLSSIPDIATENLPFLLRSHDNELWRLQNDLLKINPQIQYQKNARDFGLDAVTAADDSMVQLDYEQGEAFKQIAKDLTDIAVGIDPVSAIGRASYELYTGHNMVSGIELTNVEIGLAAATVISIGVVSTGPKIIKMGGMFVKYLKNSERVEKAILGAEKFLKTGVYKMMHGSSKYHFWDEANRKMVDKRSFEIVDFFK